MANPQVKQGYVKIATSIMDALSKTRIPGQARQVLDFIIRKTCGWNKKEGRISLSQFMEGTGLSKSTVCKCLKKLREMNLVTQKGNAKSLFTKLGNDKAVTYCFNKDFDKWRTLPKKETYVTQKGNVRYPKRKRTLPKKSTTKDTSTKNNMTKIFPANSPEILCSEFLFSKIKERNPRAKEPNWQAWAKAVDLMIRRDSRTVDEIYRLITWVQNDYHPGDKWLGWAVNILSMIKLREKWDVLWVKMITSEKKRNPYSGMIGDAAWETAKNLRRMEEKGYE